MQEKIDSADAKDDRFVSVKFDVAKEEDEEEDAHALERAGRNGVGGTTLAIISTIMGGGIVSIPYAYAVAGVTIGISAQVTVIIAIWISCTLYLQTKNILRCQTSFTVLANLCLGSISTYILNMLLVFAVFGIMALYMILFSEIAISLIGTSEDGPGQDHFLSHKTFYVCSLSVLIAPIVVRKRIQELKLSTYVLFFGVICLILLLTVLLASNGTYASRLENGDITPVVISPEQTTSEGEISAAEADTSTNFLMKLMDSVNIAVTSQGFVIALFPIYTSMARDARPRFMFSVSAGLLFTFSCYTYLSFISIAYFGEENIEPSIFQNIKHEQGIASILLRCVFLLIFFCNIPFVFFAGKIALMAIIHQCFYAKKEPGRVVQGAEDDDGFFAQTNEAGSLNNNNDQGTQVAAPQPIVQQEPSEMNFSMSFMSQSVKGEVKPEDELPTWLYLLVCFTYLVIVALSAIFIDDLTLIFSIIAGLAECTTVFILPSVLYLVACH